MPRAEIPTCSQCSPTNNTINSKQQIHNHNNMTPQFYFTTTRAPLKISIQLVTEWLPCENLNHNNNRNFNYITGHPRNSAKNKHPKTEQKQYILRLLHETKCYQEELYTTPYLAQQNLRKRLSFTSKCVQNRTQHLHFAQGSLKRL